MKRSLKLINISKSITLKRIKKCIETEGKSNSGAYDNIYDNKKWYHDNETFYHDKNTSYDQFMIQKYKPW